MTVSIVEIINEGLTVWPDGVTAVCPINREAYITYVFRKKRGPSWIIESLIDAELSSAMIAHLLKVRDERKAAFISWRLRPEFSTTNGPYEYCEQEPSRVVVDLDAISRVLRCRVLITANTNDPE